MKKWLFAILFGSALVLGACGSGDNNDGNDNGNNNQQNQEADKNQNEANGDNNTVDTAAVEDMFKNSCASCHGNDLNDGFAPDLTEIGSKYDADEIADIIENGKGSMKAQNVPDDERKEIAEWLASKK